MVNIGKIQFNTETTQLNPTSKESGFNNSVWTVEDGEQTSKVNRKEIAEQLYSCAQSNDFKSFKKLLDKISPSELQFVMYECRKNGISFIYTLKNSFPNNKNEVEEILANLKGYLENSYVAKEIKNCELAELFIEKLNSQDKESINDFIKNNITKDNINEVYSLYQAIAKAKNEIAANEKEKPLIHNNNDTWYQKLWKSLTTSNMEVKHHANRPETMFQGVLNNESMSLEEKKECLKILVDKYIEKVKADNKISQDKINKFIKASELRINECTKIEGISQNAYDLEIALAELLGY